MKKLVLLTLLLGLALMGCDSADNKTTVSNQLTRLDTPSNFGVVKSVVWTEGTYFLLKWDPVPYAYQYNIYISYDGGNTKIYKDSVDWKTTYYENGIQTYTDNQTNGSWYDVFKSKSSTYLESASNITFYINAGVMPQESLGNMMGAPTIMDSYFASCSIDISTPDILPVDYDGGVSATTGFFDSQIEVSFYRVHDPKTCEEASYRVQRAEYNDCGWSEEGYKDITVTLVYSDNNDGDWGKVKFIDTDVEAGSTTLGTKYYGYKIQAYNGGRNSSWSSPAYGYVTNAVTWYTYIQAPTGLVNSTNGVPVKDIRIEWFKVNEQSLYSGRLYIAAATYEIWRAVYGSSGQQIEGYTLLASLPVTSASLIASSNYPDKVAYIDNSTKVQGLTYYYKVRALAATSESVAITSDFSAEVTGYIAGMPQTTPTIGSPVNSIMNISWTPVGNVYRYNFRYLTQAQYSTLSTAGDLQNYTQVTANSTVLYYYNWENSSIYSYANMDTLSLDWDNNGNPYTDYASLGAGTYRIIVIGTGYNSETSMGYSAEFTK